jgi:hypothetical protein
MVETEDIFLPFVSLPFHFSGVNDTGNHPFTPENFMKTTPNEGTPLVIKDDLKNLLPPLSAEEFAGLEASLLKDGCLSALIGWNNTVIDGHHRHEICTRHQIPYTVTNIDFDSLDDAKLWILRHQGNRRNLTPFQRIELALKFKDIVAARAKERQGQRNDLHGDNIPQIFAECLETRQELVAIEWTSVSTLL